jgi:CelD/BcsL family acetyltransferase involved in cellulose biosynthesis
MTTTTTLTSNLITTDAEFAALRREWDGLHERAGGTIFQTFTWLWNSWAEFHMPGDRLHILTVRDGDELVGVLPFLQDHRGLAPMRITMMRLLGTTGAYGEYAPLVDPAHLWGVSEIFASHCQSLLLSGEADMLTLFRFSPYSDRMGVLLSELSSRNLRLSYDPHAVLRVVMELPGSAQEYFASLPSQERSLIQRRIRGLEKKGVAIEVVDGADACAFSDYADLHTASWSKRGFPGYFAYAPFRKFLEKVSVEFAAAGKSRIYFLTKDGRRFAAVHVYYCGDTCVFYLSGLDRNHELAAQSPGKVLLARAITDSIEMGLKYFDFQGGADEYKLRLGGKLSSFAKLQVWKSFGSELRSKVSAGIPVVTERISERLRENVYYPIRALFDGGSGKSPGSPGNNGRADAGARGKVDAGADVNADAGVNSHVNSHD